MANEELEPRCEGCGHKMPHLEAELFAHGLRTLPVPDMGGLRNLLLCVDCRAILVKFIRAVIAKNEATERAEVAASGPAGRAGADPGSVRILTP